jgi:serine/threonine protein kinase|tara:strand:- start:550 stop:1137 length:588 start_codon:yes stop_codon:yes gene_type:complete
MDDKIIERKRNTIYVGNETVKKELTASITVPEKIDEWVVIYEQLYNYDNRLVKVYDMTDNVLTMEKIDYQYTLKDYIKYYDKTYNHDKLNKYIAQFMDIWNNFYQFSLDHLKTHYFYHTDYKLGNVVVDKDDNLRLIDPDSFKRENLFGDIEAGKFFESLIRLSECRRWYKNDHIHDIEKDIWIPRGKIFYGNNV